MFPSVISLRHRQVLAMMLLVLCTSVEGKTHECTLQPRGPQNEVFCILSNVIFSNQSRDINFIGDGQSRVAFYNSTMDYIPTSFINAFQEKLEVLDVSGCKLKSVVVTKMLRVLYARDNYIESVIVHQQPENSVLEEIYLESNRLKDASNITNSCRNVKILDLSRNQEFAKDDLIKFSLFNGLNNLRVLNLSDVGAFYLDMTSKLPALEDLDLSRNSLMTADPGMDEFSLLPSLATLRLAGNDIDKWNYGLLTRVKTLKQVYLEDNNFKCEYLKTMLDFLNDKNINTPVNRPADTCGAGYQIYSQMCCQGLDVPVIKPTDRPTTTQTPTITPPVVTTTSTRGAATQIPVDKMLMAICGMLFAWQGNRRHM